MAIITNHLNTQHVELQIERTPNLFCDVATSTESWPSSVAERHF